jgi:hypothetical protein
MSVQAFVFGASMIAAGLAIAGCGDSSSKVAGASVTVRLPPPRPYAPEPAFSFGSAPRERR